MVWTDRARGSPRKPCPVFMTVVGLLSRTREKEKEGPFRFQNQITIYKRMPRSIGSLAEPPLYPAGEEKIIFSKLLMMFHPRLINPRTAARLTAAHAACVQRVHSDSP